MGNTNCILAPLVLLLSSVFALGFVTPPWRAAYTANPNPNPSTRPKCCRASFRTARGCGIRVSTSALIGGLAAGGETGDKDETVAADTTCNIPELEARILKCTAELDELKEEIDEVIFMDYIKQVRAASSDCSDDGLKQETGRSNT